LDEELLRELRPDLILTQELCEVCAVSYKTVEQAAARIFDADVKVVSLEPNTLQDIFSNVRTVGSLTSRDAEADALVAELTTRLDALALALTEVETRPRTLLLEWLEPPFLPGHWVPEQITFAGGDASFGRAGRASTTTTDEDLRAYDPERIVLAPCGYYKEDTLAALEHARLPACWHELHAVRAGEVWAVDATSYFSRPGPRTVRGAEILARVIHPEIFDAPEEHEAVRVATELMRR
jgi:iron complex transport system substrate-binding protein